MCLLPLSHVDFLSQTTKLRVSDLVHIAALPESYGSLKGLPAYKLKECSREKCSKLSLTNPTLDGEDECELNVVVDNPDDPWSTYKLLKYWIEHALPPSWTGLLFLNIATDKERKARPSANDKWWAGTMLVRDMSKDVIAKYKKAVAQGFTGPPPMRPIGQLGKNWPNENAKILFKRCGLEDWQRTTARTGRRTGISNVVASGAPQKLVNKFGRHKTDQASFAYQELRSESYAKLLTANWYSDAKAVTVKTGTFICR